MWLSGAHMTVEGSYGDVWDCFTFMYSSPVCELHPGSGRVLCHYHKDPGYKTNRMSLHYDWNAAFYSFVFRPNGSLKSEKWIIVTSGGFKCHCESSMTVNLDLFPDSYTWTAEGKRVLCSGNIFVEQMICFQHAHLRRHMTYLSSFEGDRLCSLYKTGLLQLCTCSYTEWCMSITQPTVCRFPTWDSKSAKIIILEYQDGEQKMKMFNSNYFLPLSFDKVKYLWMIQNNKVWRNAFSQFLTPSQDFVVASWPRVGKQHAGRLMGWADQCNNRLFDVTRLIGVDLLTHW